MSEPTPLSAARRAELVALLDERTRLLPPSEDAINRAIRRCVRHELRTSRRSPAQSAGSTAAEASPLPPPAAAPPVAPLPVASSPGQHTPPVASEVARADTAADSGPQASINHSASQPGRPAEPALPTGTMLKGYRIEGLLGIGGMGQVYRATQISMNRQVALKVLAVRYGKNARFRDRFRREARAAGRLHHPNLIGVHDVDEADGRLFFSMELVEGASARDSLNQLGKLPEDRAIDIARQCLEGLRYAHERGIVHRDIKPDNLMITTAGQVKIADLGLSRADGLADDGLTTQTGTMMGTPYYMPPEQGRDAHRADHRADLYALGATLYHLVCGRVPFDGETPVAILINSTTQPLTWPEPGPTDAMRRLIEALMQRKPEDRPASAQAGLDLILPMLTPSVPGPGVSSRVQVSGRLRHSSRHPRQPRRRPWVWVVMSLAALALLAVVAVIAAPLVMQGRRFVRLEREVREQAEQQQFAAAAAAIEVERRRRDIEPVRLSALARDFKRQWDAWAMEQAKPRFDLFEQAMTAKRPVDADAALDVIRGQEDWGSPEVELRLQREEQRLTSLRKQLGSHTWFASGLDRARRLPLFGQWWQGLFANRADAVFKDTIGRFTGAGRVSWQQAPPVQRSGLFGVWFSVRWVGGADGAGDEDFWGIEFGDGGPRLLARPGELVLERPGQARQVLMPPTQDGALRFAVLHTVQGWVIESPDLAAPVQLSLPPLRPLVVWSAPGAHAAEVQVGLPPAGALLRAGRGEP